MSDRDDFKDGVFLSIASSLSALSTCDRAAVGAVITREGRCVSWGYNGAPPGLPHCSENDHGYAVPNPERGTIDISLPRRGDTGCRNATHAEANALAYAARQGISTDGGTLYVSVAPCVNCSRLLIAAGIERVVFYREYRDRAGLHLLRDAGVYLRGPSD